LRRESVGTGYAEAARDQMAVSEIVQSEHVRAGVEKL